MYISRNSSRGGRPGLTPTWPSKKRPRASRSDDGDGAPVRVGKAYRRIAGPTYDLQGSIMALGCRIVVNVPVPDRGERPPEIVVLCVHHGDGRGHRGERHKMRSSTKLSYFANLSDVLVDQTREKLRRDDELAPFGVEIRRRLGRNRFVDRAALLLELGDIIVDGDQHVAIGRKLRLVAHGIAVARNDD